MRPFCQAALAAIYGAAAWGKLENPRAFLRSVVDYRQLPDWAAPWLAAMMPGVEAVTAAVLLLGLLRIRRLRPWEDAAAWVAGGLMLVFMAAMSVNILRGIPMDCGCFDALGTYLPAALKQSTVTWTTVGRDALFLLLVVPLVRPARSQP